MKKAKGYNGSTVRVTFELPNTAAGEQVAVVGDWNGWQAVEMQRRKDGRFSVTMNLARGRQYQYRYLVDGCRWENDWSADGYIPNPFGSDDSLVAV